MSQRSTRPAPRVSAASADAALLGVTFIWGLTFPVVKSALGTASPLVFNAVRMSVAALLLVLFLRPRRIPPGAWGAGALLGLSLAAGYAFQTAGLARTSPSISAFLTSLSVVLVPLLLALAWRRRLALSAWAGTALALAGLYLLVALPAPAAASAARSHVGEVLTLACALAFALQIVILGEAARRFGFRELATLQIAFAALFTWISVPLLAGVEAPRWHNQASLWWAIAVTAVLATAVAFTVQSWAQQFTPATHTAVIFAFEPVFAWLASLVFWRERLHLAQLLGAALILVAVLVVERGRAAAPA